MILKSDNKIEQVTVRESLETIFTPQLRVEKTKNMLYEVLKCANDDLSSVTNRKA